MAMTEGVSRFGTQAALDRALAAGGASAAGPWRLDPEQSRAELRVKTLWGLATLSGGFRNVTGGGQVSADGLVTGTLVLRADSFTSGNATRDARIRSEGFLNADRFPQLSITVAEAVPIGNGRLRLNAELQAAGTTHTIEADAEVSGLQADSVRLRAEVELSRAAFGMGRNRLWMNGDRVTATIEARFVRADR